MEATQRLQYIFTCDTTPHRHRQITRSTAPAVLREEQREHVERLNYLVHHVTGRSPSHLHVLYCNGRQASDTGCHCRVHRLRAGMRDEKSQQPTHARLQEDWDLFRLRRTLVWVVFEVSSFSLVFNMVWSSLFSFPRKSAEPGVWPGRQSWGFALYQMKHLEKKVNFHESWRLKMDFFQVLLELCWALCFDWFNKSWFFI